MDSETGGEPTEGAQETTARPGSSIPLAYVMLGMTALFWGGTTVAVRHWKMMTGFSFLGVASFTIFYFTRLQLTTSNNTSLIHGGTPFAIVVLSIVILHEKVTRGEVLGIALALSGAVIIVIGGDPARLMRLGFNIGDILVLLSMLSWAFYTVALKWLPEGLDGPGFIFVLIALAVPMLAPFYAWELVAG